MLVINHTKINDILRHEEIINNYLGYYPEIGKSYKCPFRKDKRPSFIYGYSEFGNLTWKDLATGEKGNVYELIAKLKGLHPNEVLQSIKKDIILKKYRLNKNGKYKIKNTSTQRSKQKRFSTIEIIKDTFDSFDLKFWNSFNITIQDLNKWNITKIKKAIINKPDKNPLEIYSKYNSPVFCYTLAENKYKLYRPFEKDYKWFSNTNMLQGYDKLPNTGNILIISKALKDVICLSKMGYNAFAPGHETAVISVTVLEAIQRRFKNIFVFYDNDYDKKENWGQMAAMRLLDNGLEAKNLMIETAWKSKDISDFIKNKGFEVAKKWVDNKIQSNI